MTGAIDMGSQNLTNLGFVTMSTNKSLHLSNNASDPAGLIAADKGKVWFNSTSNQVKYWDGSAAQTLGVAGAGISGTTGKIAKFTSSTAVGDSLLTESTGQVAVTGQINSTGNTDQTTNSPNINFNYGNSLFVTANCTAFALSNMVSGGNYSFAVQGNSGTCSFTHGSDTIHYAGGVSNVAITSHTIFGFVKYGTHVYVTWVTF